MVKKSNKKAKQARRDSGQPGGGQGRVDKVELGPVWPGSGPRPDKEVPIQMPGSFGQGERGASGYADSGNSSLEGIMKLVKAAQEQTNARKKKRNV